VTKKAKIKKELLKWFSVNKRSFPWRNKNISFYKLLISELFLWKTRANTVAFFIKFFFEKYSSTQKIQTVPERVLARDIKKLGLSNRRTKQLKKIFQDYSNKNIPKQEKLFRERFHVGQYVARSVLLIYYDLKLFPVDQNIKRFFTRVFDYDIESTRKISTKDETFLNYFVKKGNKEIVWAIIDFSTLVCKNRNPKCKECTINYHCNYFKKITIKNR